MSGRGFSSRPVKVFARENQPGTSYGEFSALQRCVPMHFAMLDCAPAAVYGPTFTAITRVQIPSGTPIKKPIQSHIRRSIAQFLHDVDVLSFGMQKPRKFT